jgi:hypothetical protein
MRARRPVNGRTNRGPRRSVNLAKSERNDHNQDRDDA